MVFRASRKSMKNRSPLLYTIHKVQFHIQHKNSLNSKIYIAILFIILFPDNFEKTK